MKIIRFETPEGQRAWGSYNPMDPERAELIQGDILGDFKVTTQVVTMQRILPPIEPCDILALGINYRQHGDETAMAYPDQPVLFLKASSSIIGPGEPILLPLAGPDQVDYEAELAVIISRTVKNITPRDAMECVFGYTCANDVSARDWQIKKQKSQWARGKSFDSFCPIGPWMVTRDEIPHPNDLKIRTILNGTPMQNATTGDMIFDIPTIISNLSRSMTLRPGTLILTGTPEGVGFTRKPPVFLKAGDTVSIEIEKIGALTNPVKKEQ